MMKKPVYFGKVSLPQGQDAGAVTGLLLTFTPTIIKVTVVGPDGLTCIPVKNSLSADGFTYNLTGQPTTANSELHFDLF